MSALDRITELVADGDLPTALELLVSLAQASMPDLFNETIVLSGRLKSLQRLDRRGTEDPVNLQRERIKIANSIMGLVDEFKQREAKAKMVRSTPTVSLVAPVDNRLEKIFGVNHLKSIAWLERGLAAARSVCRVITPDGLGTGFMIGSGRVMTNHHVIPDPQTASRSKIQFGYEEDATGKIGNSVSYALDGATCVTDTDLDCCIVNVLPNAELPDIHSWGALSLDFSSAPSVGEHVTIIQHPQGGPKQIAITANQIVNIFTHYLQYTTDTLPGSSGSPVFNDQWKVIALHHAGGNLVKNVRGDRMFANEGILMSALSPLVKR